MRIGELARRTGVSPRALRHYEQAGLIASTRADNGYRVYGEGAVARVSNIRHLLAAGLTLDDVSAFRSCLDGDIASAAPSARGLEIARERLAVLDARIAAQTEARNRLAAALAESYPEVSATQGGAPSGSGQVTHRTTGSVPRSRPM
ncbi:MerR family transcriptional regulator [Streptomyces narbonensis]|uniref:MerR family transcriptional regulator n=1 Tax=Streptomyces narbonensis TaxID=67333 RepID=UPI0018A6B79B|nr:MerR family transcriptional regulator [Streptomyces narbonensis]GGV96214.1 MerR family transcriptional regulator [Streptomyces narbonensis]